MPPFDRRGCRVGVSPSVDFPQKSITLCYIVVMPVISIRVSEEWLKAVDDEAAARIWKRNAAVVNLVWRALGAGDRQAVSGDMQSFGNGSDESGVPKPGSSVRTSGSSPVVIGSLDIAGESGVSSKISEADPEEEVRAICSGCNRRDGTHHKRCKFFWR